MKNIALLFLFVGCAHPQTKYSGYGQNSISPTVAKVFAPPPIDPILRKQIQSMLDTKGPLAASIAPNKKDIYFHWSVSGSYQVWKWNGNFPEQMTAGEDPTSLVKITPDGKYLILARDQGGDEYHSIYLQKTSGGALEPLIVRPKVKIYPQFLTKDGRFLYFSTNEKDPSSFEIYRIELETKKVESVFDKKGLWGIDDHLENGSLLLSLEKGHSAKEYYLYQNSVLKPLFGQNENEQYSARFGAHPGEILVLTNKFGEFQKLYSFKNNKFTELSKNITDEIEGFRIDLNRQRILLNLNQQALYKPVAYDANTYKQIKFKSPEGLQVYWGATSQDSSQTLIETETPQSPGDVYLLDWKTNHLKKVFSPSSPEADLKTFVAPRIASFKARDGVSVPELIWQSEACKQKACAVIVHLHGGPESQVRPRFNVLAQILVAHDYILVEPNFRGSTGYGKSYEKADDGAKRLKVIADIADVGLDARKQFTFNGKIPHVGVFGGSYGGYATLLAMSLFAGTYDSGIAEVGISNLKTFLNNTAGYRKQLRTSEYGDPEKDSDLLAQLSPITHINQVQAPILIAHGLNDPRVPVGEAYQFYQALEKRGQKPRLIIFPDEGHGVQKRSNRVLMTGYILDFFNTTL